MTPYYADDTATLHLGDTLTVLQQMPDASVDCVVTSPPYYGLRDYGTPGQYGQEPTPAEYVERMRDVFREVRRVLADDGTCWLNLGDSYASPPPGRSEHAVRSSTLDSPGAASVLRESVRTTGVNRARLVPDKNLLGMPWRVALALQDDGWILRSDIVWHKPNAMPESARDRLTRKHEHLFLLARQQRYWFDLSAIRTETGANPGTVWSIGTSRWDAVGHLAGWPRALPTRCILAGCTPGGVVLDPFSGSGTTGAAARQTGRRYIGIDLNASYHDLAVQRFAQGVIL